MPKQIDLPAMPKLDKSAEFAIEILKIRERIANLKNDSVNARNKFFKELIARNRASCRVNHEGEVYTLEIQHIDEHEEIKIKKG